MTESYERRYSGSRDDVGYAGPERRTPGGLDLSGLPMWIKAVSIVGFPILVALFFLGQFAGVVPSPLARIEPAMSVTNAELSRLRMLIEAQSVIQQLTADRNGRLLRQICRNGAKTELQINQCD